MRALPTKLKPASGFSHFVHIALMVLLPAVIYVLVRINFVQLALALILTSKWRMLAVRPRYWVPNIRSNAVDLFVGLAIVTFMVHTDAASWQILWATLYGLWLIFVKPGSASWIIWAQSMVGQTAGLTALFLAWKDAPTLGLVFCVWGICYASARHFYTAFDEPHTTLYAHTWGYFAAGLMWVLSHWLLFYGVISQPTLLLSVFGLGASALYYLEETDRLSSLWRRQFLFIMGAIVVVILVFSDWGDKAL